MKPEVTQKHLKLLHKYNGFNLLWIARDSNNCPLYILEPNGRRENKGHLILRVEYTTEYSEMFRGFEITIQQIKPKIEDYYQYRFIMPDDMVEAIIDYHYMFEDLVNNAIDKIPDYEPSNQPTPQRD